MHTGRERVAIVTGGARGIGRGAALALAAKGFHIALFDLLADEAEATAEELRGLQAVTIDGFQWVI